MFAHLHITFSILEINFFDLKNHVNSDEITTDLRLGKAKIATAAKMDGRALCRNILSCYERPENVSEKLECVVLEYT